MDIIADWLWALSLIIKGNTLKLIKVYRNAKSIKKLYPRFWLSKAHLNLIS